MEVFEAIRTRRSMGDVGDAMPSREAIERILDAATWAPNHHRVEPWHFFVLTGDARKRLGEVDAALTSESLPPHVSDAHRETVLELQRAKALRAPVIIAATVARPETSKVIYIENVAAVAAGVQNLLLAAHADGLAAKWRTGALAYAPAAKRLFGLEDDQHILGFIHIGYATEEPGESPRLPLSDRVSWWGLWED